MKYIKYLLVAALLVFPGAAFSQILNSAHDLSGGTEEICVYCHTPHNATTAESPLWNRNITSSAFVMYDSPTLDMTIATDPQGVSLACLSCHDGVTAYNNIVNGTATDNSVMAGARAIGADGLTNDHPISITYNTSLDTAFNAATAGKVGNLPLYGGAQDQVECASCHNPHDTTYGKFLRDVNTQSALCLTCHIK